MHFETQTIKLFVAHLFTDYDKALYFLKDTRLPHKLCKTNISNNEYGDNEKLQETKDAQHPKVYDTDPELPGAT
jgi:hypothetical protein